LPSDATKVTGTGTIKIGGCQLTGKAGTTTVQVTAALGSSTVTINAADTFETNGNVLGSSGTISVVGALNFGGSTIQTALSISGGAVTLSNTVGIKASDVTLSSGNLMIRGPGASVQLGVFQQCAAGTKITYFSSAKFSDNGGSTGTIFTFATGTAPQGFACDIDVVDADGNVAHLTPKTGATTTAMSGYVLAQSGSATWNSNSLTYTGASSTSAAGTVHANIMLIIALLCASILVLLS